MTRLVFGSVMVMSLVACTPPAPSPEGSGGGSAITGGGGGTGTGGGMAPTGGGGGGSPPTGGGSEGNAVDAFVRQLPALAVAPSAVDAGTPSAPQVNGDYSCTTTHVDEARQFDRVVAYSSSTSGLWPGALVRGDSIDTGLFTEIVVPRKPLTFSVSLENLGGTPSATVAEPKLSSYRDALNGILAQGVTGATAANISTEKEIVYSSEQLSLALGAKVSWLGSNTSVSGQFQFNRTEVKSRYFVRFIQSYYTIDVDPPARPSDMLADSVKVEDLQQANGVNGPILYVSSITYGRLVYFTLESDYSVSELSAALQVAFNNVQDIEGNTSVTNKEILSKTTIKAYVLGGSGGEAVKSISGYDELVQFIAGGGNYSKDSPGAPIAYKFAYLGDNSPAKYSLKSDYSLTECTRVSQQVRVTVKSLKVEDAASETDLELFGNIGAKTTASAVHLWQTDSTNWLQVAEGATYPMPPTTQVLGTSGVVRVNPKNGSVIDLVLNLYDDDSPLDPDVIAETQVKSYPFENGWRRTVTETLTGAGTRVLLSVELQPI